MSPLSAAVAKHRPSGDTASDAAKTDPPLHFPLSSLLTPVELPSLTSYLLVDRKSISLNSGVHCLDTRTDVLTTPSYTRYSAISRGIVRPVE